MDEKLRRYYLESQVKNASPGQMLIMLYDSLIQQAECAESEIASPEVRDNPSQAAQCITRCIDIMRELSTSLRHNEDPSLCAVLSKLYLFFTKELSAAFDQREPGKIRAILPLIRELRGAWVQADRMASQLQAVAA